MSNKKDYLWKQYNLHKKAAHQHFENGQVAEKQNNYHLAYLCYNKALDARLHSDCLFNELKGPHMIDAGHCQFTLEMVNQYRDRVKRFILQSKGK